MTLRRLALYFTLLYALVGLGNPYMGVAYTPIQFLLKDELKLDAERVSFFQLVVSLPLYGAFLFGFVRDRWSPFGMHDRGYFALFGPLSALAYAALAFGPLREPWLLAGVFAATSFSLFLSSAIQAQTAVVGQHRAMTGRLATLFQVVVTAFWGISFVSGGWLQTHVASKWIFGGLAILSLGFLPFAFRRPPGDAPSRTGSAFPELARFLRHRPMWPAAFIWLAWSFSPGMFTPLFFYLTNTLHATPEQYGLFMGLFALSFIPTLLVYGWLCRRVTLRKLLWWSTLTAIPQMLPLLVVHSAEQSLWLAPILGFIGGVPTGAYVNLMLRACPRGLEGAGAMMNQTGYFIAVRFGDLFGSWLYDRGGFPLTVWVTCGVYAAILPVLLFVPKELVARPDGAHEPALAIA